MKQCKVCAQPSTCKLADSCCPYRDIITRDYEERLKYMEEHGV
jgi:hypothetical protein